MKFTGWISGFMKVNSMHPLLELITILLSFSPGSLVINCSSDRVGMGYILLLLIKNPFC